MGRVVLSNLNPQSVIHPEDRSAIINVVDNIPGVRTALKSVGEFYGKLTAIDYMGNGVVATKESMPELHKHFVDTCNVIGLKDVPELATEWAYLISSYTVGGSKLRVVLSSGSVDLLDKEEQAFLMGQEIGHIVSGHLPYHMLLELIYTPAVDDPTFSLIAGAIRMPLLDWYRKSHYTADRFALLCCQDIDVALRTMMKMAGLPQKYFESVDPKAFLLQARDFSALQSDGVVKRLMTQYIRNSAALPWLVDRARVLMDWYNSGEYQKIIDNA